ncbi:hypothetical protein [Acetanaerobacterium elongatum]|uniref:Cu+-exporting ATPase n=1 Tax=Acetanaerobacterium elongatum TaxID=258515 RepID=A0A1H0CPL9_9FIRM|nr:hypothetical protein [Acetanaerobacterium elongatum]SDN59820.1 hypothetical protein SAMN05192585_12424 [Acetanaerobacterium elongatum]
MFDDYYSLDEILNEAKRIKEQKVYGAPEDGNTPPIIPAENRRASANEAPQEAGNTYKQVPPQSYSAPTQAGSASFSNNTHPNPAYIEQQAPQAQPRTARNAQPKGFSIARESEVFGAYQNTAPRRPQEPAPPARTREDYPPERNAGYYTAPHVQQPQPYTAPVPQQAPTPVWQEPLTFTPPSVSRPPLSGVYEPEQSAPKAYQPPVQQKAPASPQAPSAQMQAPASTGFKLHRPVRPQVENEPRRPEPMAFEPPEDRGFNASYRGTPQAAPLEPQDDRGFNASYRGAPQAVPSEPPMNKGYNTPYNGTSQAAEPEPPVDRGFNAPYYGAPQAASPEPPMDKGFDAPYYGAPQVPQERQAAPQPQQEHDTRQFDAVSPAMEAAGELAGVNPLAGRPLAAVPQEESRLSRWQSYRMLEQDGDLSENEELPTAEDFEPDENELSSPEDTPKVLRRLQLRQIFGVLRTAALTVTSVGAIYLILTRIATALPIPEAISAQKAPGMYALALFALSFVSFLVSIMPISHGLLSLFKLKANADSMTALASVATLIYTFAFVARPSLINNSNAQYYCVVAIIGLWFNSLGKLMVLSRVRHNLSVAGSGERLYEVQLAKSGEFARNAATVLDDEEPQVAVSAPAGFLKGFLHFSYDDEQAQGASRILSPICFGAAVVLSAASYFLYKDVLSCFTVFTAVLCVCAPFTSIAVINLPLLRAAKSLTPRGAMLSGSDAVESISEATAVAVNAAELFPSGSITLHGIRTFKGGRIDMSILEAASIMEKVGGTMSDIFYQIIEGRKEILENVEDIVYEEGMGISAWVNGKRVLIGNRELMRHHGVELPPREYELKYTQDGRDLMYLATSGELASMFVISYHADPAVYRRLKRLEQSGIAVLVKTTDPNITRDMLSDLYELDYDMVRIMPASLHGAYLELTEEKPAGLAGAANMGGAMAMMDTVIAAARVKSSTTTALVVQMVFILLGYALATLFTFFYGISLINPLLLLSYQLVAALVVTVFISARKY